MKEKFPVVLYFILFFAFPIQLIAQEVIISGKVVDAKANPIEGVSVIIKGTGKGTLTNVNGKFSIELDSVKKNIIVFSSTGYIQQEVSIDANRSGNQEILITLANDVQDLNDLIVTGVFDKRKRIESSIAITTLNSKELSKIVPNSSYELLRLVPGVFVNSTRGEIYNNIITRGMVLGDYVSIQEDGLPVISASGQFTPDPFLRFDLTVQRIEAVRGGTASVLGVNAPGGIFNYISKTGTTTFEGDVRTRIGLEGNGKNPYYRIEAGFGGPLGKKDSTLTYYVGGHYRYADGAKYPGYPLSKGGQVKGNLVKKYKNGFIKLYVKYLDDRTVQFESTPTVDFDKPRPAGSFTNSSSLLNPNAGLYYPSSVLGLTDVSYKSDQLNRYKDISAGLNWEHRFGKGWKLENAFRYSAKSALVNSSVIVFPFSVDKFYFYAYAGLLGKFGTYKFYNPGTGKQYGTVKQELDFSNPSFPFKFTADLNLPGGDIQPNSVFYNPLAYERSTMNDFLNQFTIKKQFANMGFTAGLFTASTSLEQYLTPPAATGYGTIEDKPQFVGIDYIPDGMINPPTYHVTDKYGISTYGNGGLFYNKATVSQAAFFFGHNWNINQKLNLDWGIRYELFKVEGKLARPSSQLNTLGGVDSDSTTLYDNVQYILGDYIPYKSTLNTFSFSGGLNYKVNNGLSFYARYAQGSKTPDFNFFNDNSNVTGVEAQKIIQFEVGAKFSKGLNNLFVTPFYSALDKVPNLGRGQNAGLPITFYANPKIYNKTHTIGVEIEGNYVFNKYFGIRANAVVQQFTADKYQFYDNRDPGPQDDTLIDRSGQKISTQAPPLIFNITPTFTYHNFFSNINWYYMGKRSANSSETFYLPAFSQFDINLGYAFSKMVSVQVSVNNIFDHYGIMSWSAPTTSGLAFETFATDTFLPEDRAANPDVVYYTLGIQPRSYFLTLSIKF